MSDNAPGVGSAVAMAICLALVWACLRIGRRWERRAVAAKTAREPRTVCVPVAALHCYVTEQYFLAFLCRAAGHGTEADTIGVCMKNLDKVLAAHKAVAAKTARDEVNHG